MTCRFGGETDDPAPRSRMATCGDPISNRVSTGTACEQLEIKLKLRPLWSLKKSNLNLKVEDVNINEFFPSKYLKAADLAGAITVEMTKVEPETFGDDTKAVLFFKDRRQGLVLNKVNVSVIVGSYGSETGSWIGNSIVIFPDKTTYQGRLVDCVRVRTPEPEMADGPLPSDHI